MISTIVYIEIYQSKLGSIGELRSQVWGDELSLHVTLKRSKKMKRSNRFKDQVWGDKLSLLLMLAAYCIPFDCEGVMMQLSKVFTFESDCNW